MDALTDALARLFAGGALTAAGRPEDEADAALTGGSLMDGPLTDGSFEGIALERDSTAAVAFLRAFLARGFRDAGIEQLLGEEMRNLRQIYHIIWCNAT